VTNRKAFLDQLRLLSELFEKEVSVDLADLYWRVFEDWDDETFNRACLEAARRCRWFPKPAELRELIEGGRGDEGPRYDPSPETPEQTAMFEELSRLQRERRRKETERDCPAS